MGQQKPKIKRMSNLLFVLVLFIGSLLFTWLRDLYTNGLSSQSLFNIVIVLLFLMASYFIEAKTTLNTSLRALFYFCYFFIIGTFGSAFIYQNQLNVQMLFLYLFLSFIASFMWLLICKKIICST
ncbi:MAG: hypothetical protein ACTIOK_10115 [Enterococcus malodoratus]